MLKYLEMTITDKKHAQEEIKNSLNLGNVATV
jgi:hypothetical protein